MLQSQHRQQNLSGLKMINLSSVLHWYDRLHSRTLDLVSDYAGDELFLIEGDSLLLHCFSNDKLDFYPGFQVLHAAYIVETLLRNLQQRKCNFQLVFFDQNAEICIPPNARGESHPRYLLARELILHHLVENVPSIISSLHVKSFKSHDCPQFLDYISSLGVYFFMCHDGAFAALSTPGSDLPDDSQDDSEDFEDDSEDESEDDSKDDRSDDNLFSGGTSTGIRSTTAGLRRMIHWFVCNGYNIALINTLRFRDTKVMITVVEGSAQRAHSLYPLEETQLIPARNMQSLGADMEESQPDPTDMTESTTVVISQPSATILNTVLDFGLPEPLEQMAQEIRAQEIQGLTQRELVLTLTVSYMIKQSFSQADELAVQALLIHAIIQRNCRLSERVVNPTQTHQGQAFLDRYTQIATTLLRSSSWKELITSNSLSCDLADLIDGRLFLEVLGRMQQKNLSMPPDPCILAPYKVLTSMVKTLCKVELDLPFIDGPSELSPRQGIDNLSEFTSALSAHGVKNSIMSSVLPFTNSILDAHLTPVNLSVGNLPDENTIPASSRVFEEITHWHNSRRPLKHKLNARMDERQAFWANRRNQFFMAEMREYAASLTNSTGAVLEPESVFVKPGKDIARKGNRPPSQDDASLGKRGRSSNCHGKKNASKTKSASAREKAVSSIQARQSQVMDKHINNWRAMVTNFEKEHDHSTRYMKVKHYLVSLTTDKRKAIENDVSAFLAGTLFQLWVERCRQNRRDSSLGIVALLWSHIFHVSTAKNGVSDSVQEYLYEIIKILRLPSISIPCHDKRALSFESRTYMPGVDTSVHLSPLEFQLLHAGPYFDRSMGSAPDSRVHDFEPDKWQRDVLDQIDSRKSLFVVAPTSAGKTFISFYAIKQVLEEDDSGILVYVAPTKALVNQIAAEVQARFSKSYKYGNGKSVWAIHTRDYRINNPTGCQVLITVPHILQIMLLAPSNAKSWSSQVRRIIFDEIHCIGQAEDGVVWEQLLLLAPCPIIALSATVGNPQEFNEWLGLTQRANGNELRMIEHRTRYSDLRKYIYQPPEKFLFNGLPNTIGITPLGLDNSPNIEFIHPVASLIDRARGMPDDFTLEPRDCWTLWQAMDKHKSADFPVDDSLNPSIALPSIITKADIVKWESKLKHLLDRWIKDQQSPFDAVFQDLSTNIQGPIPELQVSSADSIGPHSEREVRRASLLDTTLPLICSLHEQGALPALFFNYDRSWCEEICHRLLTELQEAEERWKSSSPTWKKKIAGWEAWLKSEKKRGKSKAHAMDGNGEDDRDSRLSKADQAREAASAESNPYESFDPEQPIANFFLADIKKLSPSEFNEHVVALRKRFIPEWLIEALKRGIGVHHAGMNRKYRQVCEMLFRKGYLRVVIATGTLALGINMPCKTVVFAGDSVFLTALSFRQAAGRAGRRGFDFLGNVVFQGVPYNKVCRLLSSKLPDLNGHFPITTSLVLRLMILLHESGNSPFAVKATNSLLSCPRIYLGGPESKHTVLHHLRFSIEYLRRNSLLDKNGAPLNFAGTVSHLYYTESSSFAFHALLSGGYFHELCKDINRKPKAVLTTLMLVLSHIFGRHHLRPSILESIREKNKKSPSVVILPPLPKAATEVLCAHNKSTLDIYATYVATFIKQHVHEPDCTLPLTSVKCGGHNSIRDIAPTISTLPPTKVTSGFVALSGYSDRWNSVSELCEMVRSGVWLEQAVVPYVPVQPEGNAPLNAYLYDFFRHGNVDALEKANMVRKGDIWFVLNDFSLVLATIVTSLENFLRLSPSTDEDMLDVMGGGDAHEGDLDDVAAAVGDAKLKEGPYAHHSQSTPINPATVSSLSKNLAKAKITVADSWEDELSDSDSSNDESAESDQQYGYKSIAQGKGYTPVSDSMSDGQRILLVLKAFKMLQTEFNDKFKAMWA